MTATAQAAALSLATDILRTARPDKTLEDREDIARLAWFMAEAARPEFRDATRPVARTIILTLGCDPVAMEFECDAAIRQRAEETE